MQRFIVLFTFGVASVLALDEECTKLAKPQAIHCCKTPKPEWEHQEASYECKTELGKAADHDVTEPDENCEVEQCIGKKMGVLADDGTTIDKSVLESKYADKFKDTPDLIETIKTKCIQSDVKEYGPDDYCELKKTSICIRVHQTLACSDLDDEGDCKEYKDLREKCNAA